MEMPRPISELDAENIIGVFFDIDDTFSSHGKIKAEAYKAIWELKEAEKIVVPVTGRPAGWCDHIARMWPVDAVVGENGALYFIMKGGKLVKEYAADESKRIEYKKKLSQIGDKILRAVPGTALASDQNYREFDLAIDFAEDVPRLGEVDINKIVEIAKKYGTNVKVSSIHVNIWFSSHTKLTTTKLFVKKELGMDLDKDNARFLFVGDSPNDEPMFEYFKNSVGVRNVLDFKGRLKKFPTFVTKGRSSDGFVEVANIVLKYI